MSFRVYSISLQLAPTNQCLLIRCFSSHASRKSSFRTHFQKRPIILQYDSVSHIATVPHDLEDESQPHDPKVRAYEERVNFPESLFSGGQNFREADDLLELSTATKTDSVDISLLIRISVLSAWVERLWPD